MSEYCFTTTYECEGGHDITVNLPYATGGFLGAPCPFCDEKQGLSLVGQVLLYDRMAPNVSGGGRRE